MTITITVNAIIQILPCFALMMCSDFSLPIGNKMSVLWDWLFPDKIVDAAQRDVDWYDIFWNICGQNISQVNQVIFF